MSDNFVGNLHILEEHGIKNFSLLVDFDLKLVSCYLDIIGILFYHFVVEFPFVLDSHSTHQQGQKTEIVSVKNYNNYDHDSDYHYIFHHNH